MTRALRYLVQTIPLGAAALCALLLAPSVSRAECVHAASSWSDYGLQAAATGTGGGLALARRFLRTGTASERRTEPRPTPPAGPCFKCGSDGRGLPVTPATVMPPGDGLPVPARERDPMLPDARSEAERELYSFDPVMRIRRPPRALATR